MQHETIHLNTIYPELGADGRDPFLTVYIQKNIHALNQDERKRPCLLVCPGGGYAFCSERESEPIALQFLPEGFHVLILNYSCAPHHYPVQLREVAAAMELIYQNAEKWHCDTNQIAIMGFSAGGHLAAHYSTSYDCPEIRSMFPDSKPVQASVLCYPVITADAQWAHKDSFCNLSGMTQFAADALQEFSCELHVTQHTPPTFLWHTASDSVVPVMNTLLYAQRLAACNIPAEVHIYPCGEHGLSTCDAQSSNQILPEHRYDHRWLECAKKWLHFVFSR